MFCPKCKAEYREGFTVCADCGVPLVETLSKEPEFDPVYFFTTEGDCAWELPALLRGAGVACYLYGGNGVFIRMEEDQTVPGELYVDSRDLPRAKLCLRLLSGPPMPVDEDELMEAYDDYVEQAPAEEASDGDLVSGDGAWQVFLALVAVVAVCILASIFMK